MTHSRRRFFALPALFVLVAMVLVLPASALLPDPENSTSPDYYQTFSLSPGESTSMVVPNSETYWQSGKDVVVARVAVVSFPSSAPGEPPDPAGLMLGVVWMDGYIPITVNYAPYSYDGTTNNPFQTFVVPPHSSNVEFSLDFINVDSNYGDAVVQMAYYTYPSMESFLLDEFAMRGYTDTSSYYNGYDNGYSLGSADGYNAGYLEGYSQASSLVLPARQEGYQEGYQEGLRVSDTGNFATLFDSVVSAPVNTFASMFNFEILGVNLSSLFFFVFTLMFIVAVLVLLAKLRG